jgi:HSP20 family protein
LLSISSEKEEEKQEISKVDNYYKKEFNYQSFRRSFSLPDYADENKISADYKDGILHVEIDKKEGAKQRVAKTIAIK